MATCEGLGASVGQQPPDLGAAAGGQQRHALGGAEAVVERLHPLVDPLAPMLPRLVEPLPVQLARVGAQDLAAEPLDRLDLDPLGAAQPARRLHRRTSPLSAFDCASSSSSPACCSAARFLSASSSGPAASLERGSARTAAHSAPHPWPGPGPGTSPAPARPRRSRPGRPRRRRCPRTGLVTLRGRSSSRLRAIWSSQ